MLDNAFEKFEVAILDYPPSSTTVSNVIVSLLKNNLATLAIDSFLITGGDTLERLPELEELAKYETAGRVQVKPFDFDNVSPDVKLTWLMIEPYSGYERSTSYEGPQINSFLHEFKSFMERTAPLFKGYKGHLQLVSGYDLLVGTALLSFKGFFEYTGMTPNQISGRGVNLTLKTKELLKSFLDSKFSVGYTIIGDPVVMSDVSGQYHINLNNMSANGIKLNDIVTSEEIEQMVNDINLYNLDVMHNTGFPDRDKIIAESLGDFLHPFVFSYSYMKDKIDAISKGLAEYVDRKPNSSMATKAKEMLVVKDEIALAHMMRDYLRTASD